MRDFNPLEPDGTDGLAVFARAVRSRTHGPAGRLNSSSTVKVSKTSRGITLHAKPSKGGSAPATTKQYSIIAVLPDYLQCSSGATTVYIAKSTKLRLSIGSETIDGTAVSYAPLGPTNQLRTATVGTNSETQVVVPRYLVGDAIYAFSFATGITDPNGKKISLVDMNIDGRAWAAVNPNLFT